MPRTARRKFSRHAHPGCAVQFAHIKEIARVLPGCCHYARVGHWRDGGGVLRCQRRSAPAFWLQQFRKTFVDLFETPGQSAHQFFIARVLRLPGPEHIVRRPSCDRIVQPESIGFGRTGAGARRANVGERVFDSRVTSVDRPNANRRG